MDVSKVRNYLPIAMCSVYAELTGRPDVTAVHTGFDDRGEVRAIVPVVTGN